MNIPCIKCKGATPMQSCGRTFCPIMAKSESLFKVRDKLPEENFFGSSPTPFVGHNFYPNLYVGILSSPEQTEDAWLHDAPNYWADHNFEIPQIIDYRSALINSRFRLHVKQRNNLLDIGQEIGMASKPVDIEINLEKKPTLKLNTDPYHLPMGPNAKLEKAKITENPKIDTRVDKVVSDTDLKANDALLYLYEKGFSENFLTKILSIGNLGLKNNRKLVPTRWSITAADDTLAKHLLHEVKQYQETNYLSYFGGYLGNYFLILFFPEEWSYELFETYAPHAEWNISNEYKFMTDYEPYEGRKTYAENCGGGYYAARLPILEKLSNLKRQGYILTLRFITGEYSVPLGVWVVREAVRKSLNNRPIEFSSKELMLKYATNLVKKKFNYNAENLLEESILLRKLKTQSKLTQFL
ncbi:MAG: hypothetical protein U9O94_11905 [Nanoarchaeota archaeon]|nr:hypothetical protein [Nanoarchaeota archaeon]